MDLQPLEVYAADPNYAVIKPPSRQYPGCVIQGDTLRSLCGLALGIARWFREAGPKDDPEALRDVQDLVRLLVGRLLHYQRVLSSHGHRVAVHVAAHQGGPRAVAARGPEG